MSLVTLPAYKAIVAAVQSAIALIGNALALRGEGTNGATNSTFLDSSSNERTVTKFGTVGQGPQSPFYGNTYGMYCDGASSAYFPPSAQLTLGTGDFTIECFFYSTEFGNIKGLMGNATGGDVVWGLYVSSGGGISFSGVQNAFLNSTDVVTLHSWNHVAVCRLGNVVSIYLNGLLSGQATLAALNLSAATPTHVGRIGDLGYPFTGFISNARIIKGVCQYTSDFTPSAIPLTALTGTSLLTAQSAWFRDESSWDSISTLSGFPKVVHDSPFTPTYDATIHGGSGHFDGNSYLDVVAGAAGTFGTGAYCMELWIYITDLTSFNALIGNIGSGGSSSTLYVQSSGMITLSTYAFAVLNSTVNVRAHEWTHLVCCRDASGNIAMFLNGVRCGTVNSLHDGSDATSSWRVGSDGPTDNVIKLKGYATNARLVKGNSVYDPASTTLVVPDAPLVDAGAVFLLNCAEGKIVDSSLTASLSSIGSTQISTSKFKRGSSSVQFNGTTDYLLAPANAEFAFKNDLTIAFWMYPQEQGGHSDLIGNYVSDTAADWVVSKITGNIIGWYPAGATNSIQSPAIPNDVWTHVALVRSGTTCTMYINGVSVGTMTQSGTLGDATRPIRIGGRGSVNFFNGYIDELNVMNGSAAYLTSFDPETGNSVDPYFSNVGLLMHMDGANGSTSFLDQKGNTIVASGSAIMTTAQSKFGSSAYTSSDANSGLTVTHDGSLNLTNTDFTIESWINPSSAVDHSIVSTFQWSAGYQGGWNFTFGNNTLYIQGGTTAAPIVVSPAGVVALNVWSHVAVTRSGNVWRLFVNGVKVAEATAAVTINTPTFWYANKLVIGAYKGDGGLLVTRFQGYIDDVRITPGIARYTADFAAPTAALLDA